MRKGSFSLLCVGYSGWHQKGLLTSICQWLVCCLFLVFIRLKTFLLPMQKATDQHQPMQQLLLSYQQKKLIAPTSLMICLYIIHLDFVTNATLTKLLICKQYSSADDSMVLLLDTCSYSPLLIFKRNKDILVCYQYQNIFSVQMDAQIQCIHFKCHTCRTTNLGMKVCKTDIHV